MTASTPQNSPKEYVVPTADELLWSLDNLHPGMTSMAFEHYERLWAYIHHSHAMIDMNGRLLEQLEAVQRELLEYRATYCEHTPTRLLLEHELGWTDTWEQEEWDAYRDALTESSPVSLSSDAERQEKGMESCPASSIAAIIDTEPPSDEDVAYFKKLHEADASSPATSSESGVLGHSATADHRLASDSDPATSLGKDEITQTYDGSHPRYEAVTSSAEIKAALEEAEAELAAVYRKVWPLREAYAEAVPPAELPAARHRTEKQERVARCPRCGGRLDADEEQAPQ